MHAFDTFDRRTDRQTDGRTEFPSLYRDCIPCSAVKCTNKLKIFKVTPNPPSQRALCIVRSAGAVVTPLDSLDFVELVPHLGETSGETRVDLVLPGSPRNL